MNTALLVIDVRQHFCEGEHAAVGWKEVIDRINRVARKARAAGAPVIFVQHESTSGPLQYGADGWQIARELQVEPVDLLVRKTTPDAFHNTQLHDLLAKHRIESLAICGMHSEFCVDTTTRKALELGFPVLLLEDAHTTENKSHLPAASIVRHHNETLANITSFGPRARLVASESVSFSVQPTILKTD
jgi:nicotinamidase-related amidase